MIDRTTRRDAEPGPLAVLQHPPVGREPGAPLTPLDPRGPAIGERGAAQLLEPSGQRDCVAVDDALLGRRDRDVEDVGQHSAEAGTGVRVGGADREAGAGDAGVGQPLRQVVCNRPRHANQIDRDQESGPPALAKRNRPCRQALSNLAGWLDAIAVAGQPDRLIRRDVDLGHADADRRRCRCGGT